MTQSLVEQAKLEYYRRRKLAREVLIRAIREKARAEGIDEIELLQALKRFVWEDFTLTGD